jgi:hypothetical protein
MQQAADFCLVNDVNLEEGLSWADRSINTYFGEANFRTLSTYAGLLEKAGRQHEADSLMKLAFPKGSTRDIYFYGSKLLRMKRYKAAAIKYADNSIQLVQDQGTKEYIGRLKQDITNGKDVSGF